MDRSGSTIMKHNRRRADELAELTERELLVAHTVKIETLCRIMQDTRTDLNRHYERLDQKVDWKNFKWFVGLVTAGVLCLTGYTVSLNDRIAKNTQEIAVHMGAKQ